jgi:hypothetical protein
VASALIRNASPAARQNVARSPAWVVELRAVVHNAEHEQDAKYCEGGEPAVHHDQQPSTA